MPLRASRLQAISIVSVLIALPVRLWPQFASGTIVGVVKDSTGAVIPAATVTVVEQQTGSAVSVKSLHDGAFLVPNLAPAIYRVSGESAGFKRLVIDSLKVDVGSTLTQDLVLEIGVTTELIQVAGQTSLVETVSGEVGTTVQVDQVLEMPLVDRNVFNLVNMVPGSFAKDGLVSLGGGRPQSTLAMIDGVNNTKGGLGVTNIELAPPVDSMQEFKVEINGYGAEFGHSASGVVNAVTKSGTNRFHFSLYEFLRNDKFDAAGWGVAANPPLRRNNFGGTAGGPIIKNRTFFFSNVDALIQHTGVTKTRNVGLPAWRTGDFSTATRDAGGRAAPVVIYDPDTGSGTFATPINTTPFPNNIIPTARLDPVAVKALTYIPAPNRVPNDPYNQTGNWQENTVNSNTSAYHTVRVDHEWTEKTKLFVRYNLIAPETAQTGYSKGYGVSDVEGASNHNRHQNVAINGTHLFSPTKFVNYTMGVNRVYLHSGLGDCCSTNYGKLLGIPNVPGEVFPYLNFGGGLAPVDAIGANGNANRIATFTNWDYIANFTDIRGKHTLKYGVQYSRFNANDLSRASPSGSWTSNGQYTRGILANGSVVANTGLNLADFLLGRLGSVSAQVSPSIGKRLQYYAGYIQDDWRITPRLTLNVGLRYETETPAYEVAGRMNNFDFYAPNPLAGTGDIPVGATGVTTFPNRNGEGKYLWNWNFLNFAPRFGFAWRVLGTNDTVIRGGFGLFYGDAYDREIIQEERLGFSNNYQARVPVPTTLKDGIPAGALNDIPASALTPTFGDRGTQYETAMMQYLDGNRKTPYSENFNLTIQHQWKGILFEIAGLGNLGRQMDFPNINTNHIPPNLLARTDIPERLRRPITVLGSDTAQVMILSPNWGLSNYSAFTFKSERRYANGIGWIVAYTFTRWIDNLIFAGTPFGDNNQIQNEFNLKGERTLSTNCIPHRLVLSPIVEAPFGKGKRWFNRGFLSEILGGWQIATIATLQSGAPFGAGVLNGTRDLLGDNSAGTFLRPDLVSSNLMVPDNVKGTPAVGIRGIQWLNPAAFAPPPLYTFGDSSRTLPGVLGPGTINFDSLLAKNFYVKEQWRVQFRWETFNLTNTPHFGNPNENVGAGGFGIITTATSRRIMQFGLKLYW